MDSTSVTAWLEGLGLQTATRAGATGAEVTFGARGSQELDGLIRWRAPDMMDVYNTRRISSAALATQWRDPSNVSTPNAVLREAVTNIALAFPLVAADVSDDDSGAVVYFSAPLFGEQLTRQAFALTVSSVQKAAATFDVGAKIRAEQLAALAAMEARRGVTVTAAAPPQAWQPGNGGRS